MTQLEKMISSISDTMNALHGIETVEPALFEIVDMVRGDQNLKVEFLALVAGSFENPDKSGLFAGGVPRELVELATHELKWPEFAVLADKRIQDIFGGDESLAMSDVSQSVKAAYADDWEDRDLFERYAA
jgi:hypothetical protein